MSEYRSWLASLVAVSAVSVFSGIAYLIINQSDERRVVQDTVNRITLTNADSNLDGIVTNEEKHNFIGAVAKSNGGVAVFNGYDEGFRFYRKGEKVSSTEATSWFENYKPSKPFQQLESISK